MTKQGARQTATTESPAARCAVRLLRPGDEPAVVELLRTSYPTWPKIETEAPAIEHFRWKIAEPSTVRVVLGEIAGELVGMSMRALRPAKAGRAGVLLHQGFDSCVLPDFREAGVMSAIRGSFRDLLETQGDLLLFVSSHPAFDRIRTSEGAHPLSNPVRVLACNPPFFGVEQREATAWTIESPARFDERVDEFGSEAAAQFDVIIERNKDWLNWRYADVRGGASAIKTAEQDGRLLGYAVLRTMGAVGHIADLLALPGRSDVARSLIVGALRHFQGRGVTSVRCWCPALHPYGPALAGLGFTNKRKTMRLDWVAFTARPDRAVLQDERLALHFMAGDTDLA